MAQIIPNPLDVNVVSGGSISISTFTVTTGSTLAIASNQYAIIVYIYVGISPNPTIIYSNGTPAEVMATTGAVTKYVHGGSTISCATSVAANIHGILFTSN